MLESAWLLFSASGFFRGERERLPETGSSAGGGGQGGEAVSDVYAHHLIGQKGDHAKHQMAEHFPPAAHPDVFRHEPVPEAAKEALHGRALPIRLSASTVFLITGISAVSLGAFPDGQSCLCLAAARLKHVAGTQWSTRKYMNMEPLREMKLQHNGAAVA